MQGGLQFVPNHVPLFRSSRKGIATPTHFQKWEQGLLQGSVVTRVTDLEKRAKIPTVRSSLQGIDKRSYQAAVELAHLVDT